MIDKSSHHVVGRKCNVQEGEVVAGEKGQLDNPTDVMFDVQNHSIIIANRGSR